MNSTVFQPVCVRVSVRALCVSLSLNLGVSVYNASALAAITAVYGVWVSLANVISWTWFYKHLYCTDTAIYCFTSYDKCTNCKSLWIIASAKCPKCKCTMCVVTADESAVTCTDSSEVSPRSSAPNRTLGSLLPGIPHSPSQQPPHNGGVSEQWRKIMGARPYSWAPEALNGAHFH